VAYPLFFLAHFGNITFASLVLGTIIKGDFDHLPVLLIGGGITATLIAFGITALTITGEEK